MKKRTMIISLLTLSLVILSLFFAATKEDTIIINRDNNVFDEGGTLTITDSEKLKEYAEQNDIPLEINGYKLEKIDNVYQEENK